jgi:hypothetical protein
VKTKYINRLYYHTLTAYSLQVTNKFINRLYYHTLTAYSLPVKTKFITRLYYHTLTASSLGVKRKFRPGLAGMLAKARAKGWIEQENVKAKGSYFKRAVDECHVEDAPEGGQISVSQLTGPLLITFVCTTVSLLFRLFQKLSCVANAEGKAKEKLSKRVSNRKVAHKGARS